LKSLRSPVDLALRDVIRRERERAGLNQTELAKRLHCRQPRISTIESGERARVDVPEFVAIARAFGKDPCDLLHEIVQLAGQSATGKATPIRKKEHKKRKKKKSRGE
jgi:transcriptional regulator with XRE-family HTH domain